MKKAIGLGWLLAMLCWAPGLWAAPGETGWRLVSDKNDIRVYRQDDDEARIKTFRGVTRFPITNPASLEALLNDYDAIPRWMHFISNGRELSRRDYLNRKLLFTTELPWPLSDRDVVTNLVVTQTSDRSVSISARHDASAPLRKGYVRIPELNGRLDFLFFLDTHEVEVTYEIVMDPGGNIPAWAANIVLKDTPHFTLLKLRRIVEDPKYRSFKGKFFEYPWW